MTDGECVNMRYACKKMSPHALKLMHAEAPKSQIVMLEVSAKFVVLQDSCHNIKVAGTGIQQIVQAVQQRVKEIGITNQVSQMLCNAL